MAVQDRSRTQGLVKPVVQLVGAAVKILPRKKYFPQGEGGYQFSESVKASFLESN